jgi:hypothetical protein
MRLGKTITAASFFLALFISQAGYYFIHSIKQNYLKEQAEKKIVGGIPDKMLTAVDAGADGRDIQWKEERKEFYLRGQLYDVAKRKNVNGKEIIYCFNDRDEGKLLQQFNKAVRSGTEQNADGKNCKQTIKFQFTDLIITVKKTMSIGREIASNYFNFNDHILPGTIEVKSPPPKG